VAQGDLVKWSWNLAADSWEDTVFTGVVVGSRWAKTDREKVNIFKMLANDGTLVEVREDEPTLEVISASR
jgi:hypothetical protein